MRAQQAKSKWIKNGIKFRNDLLVELLKYLRQVSTPNFLFIPKFVLLYLPRAQKSKQAKTSCKLDNILVFFGDFDWSTSASNQKRARF